MTTNASNQQEITELKREVTNLRSLVIALAGKDPEGKYQPKFIEKVLQAADEEIAGEFTSSERFLNQLG